MRILSRSAITIIYKKPFIDWNNNFSSVLLFDDNLLGESKTYLTNEIFDDAGILLKKYYKEIFEIELEGIWTDTNDWPQKITFKLFGEWFDYEVSDIVTDLLNKNLYD